MNFSCSRPAGLVCARWILQKVNHEIISLITALPGTRSGYRIHVVTYIHEYIHGSNYFLLCVLGQIFPLPLLNLMVLSLERKGMVVPGFKLSIFSPFLTNLSFEHNL